MKLLGSVLNSLEENLKVFSGKGEDGVSRVALEGPDFRYTFLTSDVAINPLFNEVKASLVGEPMLVDFLQLYRMTELAAELPYSIAKIELNYDGSALKFVIKTRKEQDAEFRIEGTSGDFKAMSKPIVVQAKQMKLLLRGFQSFTTIGVSLSPKGLGLTSDVYSGVLVADPS